MPQFSHQQQVDRLCESVIPNEDPDPIEDWLIAQLFDRLRVVGRPSFIHFHYWLSTNTRGVLDDALRENSLPDHGAELQRLRAHVQDMIAIAINLREYDVDYVLSAWQQEYNSVHRDEAEPSHSPILIGFKLLLLTQVYECGQRPGASKRLMAAAEGVGNGVAAYLQECLVEAFETSAVLTTPDVDGTQVDHEGPGRA